MPSLYDELVRIGLQSGADFEYNQQTDSLMRVRSKGVRKLVAKRYWVNRRRLHVSMIPDDNGVVETALVSLATERKRPGFWHVILDTTGRPVAEHPLTWSSRKIKPEPLVSGNDSDHPPSLQAGKGAEVETTGELARMMTSWMVADDRVNDDESAAILEILSVHADSPRNVKLPLRTRRIAQRLHDEVLCFVDDAGGIPDAVDQATKLHEKIALLLTEYPV
jgi:hypothetical protein